MDYDSTAIPDTYAAARALPPAVMAGQLETIAQVANTPAEPMILDVGCGTGRFALALADRLGGHVLGVDPSARMLAEAEKAPHPRVDFARGEAGALPVPDASADLIFLSNVWHHIPDAQAAAAELARALEPGGRVVVRNYVAEDLHALGYLQFFPEARAVSQRDAPEADDIAAVMAKAGFKLLDARRLTQPVAASPAAYAEKVAARAYSDLVMISDDAFTRGLATMRAAVESGDPIRMDEPLRLVTFGY